MSIKILGIEVDRKTDVLALAAFLLALAGIIYQFSGYLEGPDVKLLPPEQILIFPKKMGSGKFVVFTAPMAYVNKGQPGYNAAIKRETLSFTLAGKKYQQTWQEFVSSGSVENKLKIKKEADAHPLAINAGSTVSHETQFSPRSVQVKGNEPQDMYKNYLTWGEFIKALAATGELEFEFVADLYEESPVKVKCRIYTSKEFVKYLQENKWHASACWSN